MLRVSGNYSTCTIHANRPLQDHVSYIGTGESRRSGGGVRHRGAFQAGTLTVCPAEPGRGYQLVLARGGRTESVAGYP